MFNQALNDLILKTLLTANVKLISKL